ncbi:MAG: hypothetical protein E7640_03500 [Ruminococcaceae bacterium]|nr:hypothetical protein [Oscillospiraceae bacterium]
MRYQTFGNYLKGQIKEMTGIERFQLSRLAPVAEKSQRLRVPFLLYLHEVKSKDEIASLLGEIAFAEYEKTLSDVEDVFADANSLPIDYRRVIAGYARIFEAHKAENESKRLIAKRIAERRRGLDLSDYRICRELNINPGNFNAFFYHGNDNALSLDKVKLIYRFIEFCRERLL